MYKDRAYRITGTQDPQVGPGTLKWDPKVGPGTLKWDPQVGP